MDLKSMLGYANGSPFASNPYLDIQTPEGLITMQNTPIDLLGIDNVGNVKRMKAGRKNPYKFEGDVVREIPLKAGGLTTKQYLTERGLRDANDHGDFDNISPNKARQILHDKKVNGKPLTPEQFRLFGFLSKGNTLKFKEGGVTNPYHMQSGGMTDRQLFDFIFDDEEEPKQTTKSQQPTAPTTNDIPEQEDMNQLMSDDEGDQAFIASLLQRKGNPYTTGNNLLEENKEILSSGEYGSRGVGEYGKIIYNDLTRSLGYAPVANSIYRSEQQQNALIASGAPAVKNSYHLTGNAVDIKPADWHRLTDEQQQHFRSNYDVVYHNNHYHIEPKN